MPAFAEPESTYNDIAIVVKPNGTVQEDGRVQDIEAEFKNISSSPVILKKFEIQPEKGDKISESLMTSLARASKVEGTSYTGYNVLFPNQTASLSAPAGMLPGDYTFKALLHYVVIENIADTIPIYKLQVRLTRNKRAALSKAKADTIGDYDIKQKKPIGKLGAYLAKHKASRSNPPKLFADLKVVPMKNARTFSADYNLKVTKHAGLGDIRKHYPKVKLYRANIPFYDTAYIDDYMLHAKQGAGYRRLGIVSFEALSQLGRLVSANRPIEIRANPNIKCLGAKFKGRFKANNEMLGQAAVIGQEMPILTLKKGDLDAFWECMQPGELALELSEYYDYLVVVPVKKSR